VREEAAGPYGRMLGPSNIVSYTNSTRQRNDLPFQTDRAQSARVGNIMMCYADVKSEVALSSPGRPLLPHVLTRGANLGSRDAQLGRCYVKAAPAVCHCSRLPLHCELNCIGELADVGYNTTQLPSTVSTPQLPCHQERGAHSEVGNSACTRGQAG
jgi:hypothetical protein